jgi:DNA sulfur modification protein DndC
MAKKAKKAAVVISKQEMIDNVQALVAAHGSELAFVVNMSGGKDSVRMLGYLQENFPNVKQYVVYADTGFEHVKPVSAEEFGRQRSATYGLDLHVVRNAKKTYLSMVEKRRMFPSPKYRQCTSDLKRAPIQKFLRNLPETVIINCTGIRAGESVSRSKQNPWKANKSLSKQGKVTKKGKVIKSRTVFEWMPIFSDSLHDVLDWHSTTNTPLHPVYVWAGGYLKRLSCRVCIFSTTADIHAIYKNDREAFDLVANLEQRMGFTMKAEGSLFQIIGQEVAADDQYGSEEEMPCAA